MYQRNDVVLMLGWQTAIQLMNVAMRLKIGDHFVRCTQIGTVSRKLRIGFIVKIAHCMITIRFHRLKLTIERDDIGGSSHQHHMMNMSALRTVELHKASQRETIESRRHKEYGEEEKESQKWKCGEVYQLMQDYVYQKEIDHIAQLQQKYLEIASVAAIKNHATTIGYHHEDECMNQNRLVSHHLSTDVLLIHKE